MSASGEPQIKRTRQYSALLRQFVTFYFGFALVPLALLFFLFLRYGQGSHTIGVSRANLGVLILLVGTVSLVGFFAMRHTLTRFIRLAQTLRGPVQLADRKLIGELMNEEGEVAELAKSFNQIITQLEANITELEDTKATLHEVLAKVGKALASMDDFNILLQLVLETTTDALGAAEGVLLSWDEEAGVYRLEAVTPENGETTDAGALIALLQPHLDWVRSRAHILVQAPSPSDAPRADYDPPLMCAPLSCHDRFWGVICVAGREKVRPFAQDEVKILESLSYQIALTFENIHLTKDRERTYFETISALALAVEARDPYSRGHSERVGEWSARIGASMGLSAREQQELVDASRLHDIGKIGITDTILLKSGKLSDEEMTIMRGHAVIGERIVSPIKSCQHLLDPIRHHHERLDGSGYPDGLRGEAISRYARIMMVADVYDALTSARPYRGPMTWEEVKTEFLKMTQRGQLDADVVGHFIRIVETKTMPTDRSPEETLSAQPAPV